MKTLHYLSSFKQQQLDMVEHWSAKEQNMVETKTKLKQDEYWTYFH